MHKIFLFGLIIFLAMFVRLWNLERSDINPDEFHYINDAYRLANKDPYISVRYHAFMHPVPSIGHPFFAQIISALIFKIFEINNFTARLPYALGGVITVLLLYPFTANFGKQISIGAMFLISVIPFP